MTGQSEQTQLAVIATDISYIKGAISDIKTKLYNDYATKEEVRVVREGLESQIEPIRTFWAKVAVFGTTFILGAILALIFK